ncbi:DNA cross-link repair 1A protein [Ambystoma mexicanum]|uniref:DNA cross-link repair 1A protein n=1 Tax=Ambystoma mexicanum TaxID=8296 RepID=UPI0037E906B7
MSAVDVLEDDDIWEYKSIRKPKSQNHNNDATVCTPMEKKPNVGQGKPKRSGQRKTGSTQKSSQKAKERKHGQNQPILPVFAPEKNINKPTSGHIMSSQSTTKTPVKKQSPSNLRPIHEGHCPNCQMPFSVLLVQTPRWHVDECLDAPGNAEKECPDGLQCSSTIPSHYKRYCHFLLAQSRAGSGGRPLIADQGPEGTRLNCPGAATVDGSRAPRNAALLMPGPGDISYSPLASDDEETEDKLHHLRKRLFYAQPSGGDDEEEAGHGEARGLANGHYPQHGFQVRPAALQPRDAPNGGHHGGQGPPARTRSSPALNSSPSEAAAAHFKEEPAWTPDFSSQGDWAALYPGSPTRYSAELFSSPLTPPTQVKAEEEEMPLQPITSPLFFQGPARCFSYKDEAGPSSQGGAASQPVKPEALPLTQSAAAQEALPLTQNPAAQEALPLTQNPAARGAHPNAKAVFSKALRQTDIGVFFGLKPKAKEEKPPERTLSQNVPAANAGGAPCRGRGSQRKRKAGGSVGDADPASATPASSGVPVGAAGGQQGWPKRFRESGATEGEKGKRQCPFYKKIPGTGFTVDAFQFGRIEGCTAYFLTHFHADHYGGLTKKFQFPIYCSKITGNLVRSKLRVEDQFINTLPMDTECFVDGIKVVLLEANHCPGAVLLLFYLPNGTSILHTGDFRADPSMEQYPALIGRKIHTLYLDTTYCSPEYTFPPQQEAIQFAVTTAFEMVTLNPRTLVVCGTYSIGKEKVFLAIADVLGCKVCVSQDKSKTLQCLESKVIDSLITTDWNSTSLHVLPMMQVNFKGLLTHLNKFSGRYDRVLAFKPTGWTYSERCDSVADIKPTVRGKITLYGIPYSEHSSYLEMKRFVQWLKPHKIIPTVNMGNYKTRTTMEKYFSQWMTEPALAPQIKMKLGFQNTGSN